MNALSAAGAEKEFLIPFYTLDRKKQSLIAFKTEVAMRWYAFLPLLLVFLLATPTLLPDQAGDLGQATLTMQATVLGHSHFTDKQGCRWDDEVSITVTERVQFRIVAMPNGALDLKMMSHQNSFATSGEGKAKGKNCDASWTYHIKDHVGDSLVGVWVNLGTGRGGFIINGNFIHDAELETTMSGPGGTFPNATSFFAGGAAAAAVDEPFMAISQPAKDFMKQLEFSFKPYSKNVSAHRSADYTYQLPTPETPGSAELHMDFSLVAGAQEESEAEIIPPSNYASWLPKAGEDEEKPGNTIKVKARVHKKDDPKTPFYKKARFKFQLVEVSKEKGVDLNWPEKEDSTDGFDLKIEPKTNDLLKVAGDGQSAESAAGQNESSVTITSHDWGAYGKIKVTVVFDDGSFDNAHVLGDKSKQALTIPKDDNDNHIADFWEKHYPGGSSDPKADDDLWPLSDEGEGDGLSLYEEYRGFHQQTKHIRTSPIVKDLFVRDVDGLGLGYFALSGLTVHLIREDEWGREGGAANDYVINLNRGFATRGQQHMLKMWNENLDGNLGETAGPPGGPPKDHKSVKIDVAACRKSGANELESTIAHELSHGCNVRHHGATNYKVKASDVELLLDGTWEKLVPDTPGTPKKYSIAAQGGQESGVEECIMRYEGESFYENPKGNFRWKKPDGALQLGKLYWPTENPGTIFCDKPDGTGVNDEKKHPGDTKAGRASMGKCKSQFCVNDNKH
jgi:hypothetical protein